MSLLILPQTIHRQRVVVKHMKKLAVSSNMYSNVCHSSIEDIPPRSLQWRHPIPSLPLSCLMPSTMSCDVSATLLPSLTILKTNHQSNKFVAKTPSSGLRHDNTLPKCTEPIFHETDCHLSVAAGATHTCRTVRQRDRPVLTRLCIHPPLYVHLPASYLHVSARPNVFMNSLVRSTATFQEQDLERSIGQNFVPRSCAPKRLTQDPLLLHSAPTSFLRSLFAYVF